MLKKFKPNKKFRVFYLITIIVLFLSSCQQNPEKEIIVNKYNSNLDSLIMEKADQNDEGTKIEDRIVWEETKNVDTEIGECSVSVSMDVEMPKRPEQVPVYLIKPKGFSVDFIETVVNYLMPGEVYDGKSSKHDITMELLNVKKDISEHTILDGYQSEVENYYNFFNQKYNNASEENNVAKYEFVTNDYGQTNICVKSYPNDSCIANFYASKDETGMCNRLLFRVNEFNRSYRYLNQLSGESIQANGESYDKALKTANNAMTTLFDEPLAMVHVSIADKINDLEYFWNDGEETSLGQSYVFCFSREYDGIPSLYIDPVTTVSTEKTAYLKPYVREYALVVVDDRGVVYLSYDSYSDMIEKLNNDVKLLAFEEIIERFKHDVFHCYLWGSAKIEITRIEFGLVREPIKDESDQYMMVPAWSFIGNVKSMTEEHEKSILTLNAINGSPITDYEAICAPK